MRLFIALASAALAFSPIAPANAQDSGGFAIGTQVVDTSSNPVGTVIAVNGDVVTVKTDKLEAQLGKASFAQQGGKLYIGNTQAELNALVEQEKLAAEASLGVGKPVKGAQGVEVGTIEAIDADYVTLKLTSGKSVRIPRSGIAGSANGAVIGMTAADIEAAAGGN
jgi:hypothetical protein